MEKIQLNLSLDPVIFDIIFKEKMVIEKQYNKNITLDEFIEDSLIDYFEISLGELQFLKSKYIQETHKKDKSESYIDKIINVLNSTKSKKKAAEKLNISERTLYRYINKYNITKKDKKYFVKKEK